MEKIFKDFVRQKDGPKTEKEVWSTIADMLENEEVAIRPQREEIYKFFKERTDIQLIPKLKEIMDYVLDKVDLGQLVRAIIRGPRGGGKTFGIASTVEFPLWFWYDFDCVNMGGSASQAKKAYKAIKQLLDIPEVSKQVAKTVISSTEKHNGTWINVLATSSRQVRSPHPGGKNKGGLLFVDEECEIPAADPPLVEAAKPLVNSANPSVILRVSTQHKVGDTFEETWDNAKKLGYKKFEFDIFDACKTCTRDCRINIEEDEEKGCFDQIRKDTYDKEGKLVKKGYCKGKAHRDGIIYDILPDGEVKEEYVAEHDWKGLVEGWVAIEEIFQAWLESDIETFEVEWMGKKKSRIGKIYAPDLLDEATLDEFDIPFKKFLGCEKSIGIDWGFSGMCVVTYFFKYKDTIYLYWIDIYRNVGANATIGDIVDRDRNDKHEMALGDAEGKYENDNLASKVDFLVQEVAFAAFKEFGISWIKNCLEKHTFKVLKYWQGEKNPGFDIWDSQMRGYKYGPNGKPLKKKDHGPDSTLCGMLRWAPKRRKKKSMDETEPKLHVV